MRTIFALSILACCATASVTGVDRALLIPSVGSVAQTATAVSSIESDMGWGRAGPTIDKLIASGFLYIDHRGWPNLFPEETMEAYRDSVASGAQFVEVDVQSLRDGTLVCMHDDTVDRTTTATGNVSSFTGPKWSQLVVDSGAFLGGGWGDFRPPFFSDIIQEFGNRVVLLVEIKDQQQKTADAALAMLKNYGVSKERVIVNSSSASCLTGFTADGWKTCINYDTYTGTPTPSAIAATGVKWVSVYYATSTSQMDALRAAGLKVMVYTIDNLKRLSPIKSHADAAYTDEGLYMRGLARITSDPFAMQTWYHGHIAGITAYGNGAGRGAFYPPNMWGLDTSASNNFASSLMGWANPIGGSDTCTACTIDFTVKFESALLTSRFASIAIADSDNPFTSDTGGSGLNGYHFICAKDGSLSVYKLTNGSPTLLETKSVGVTPIPDGGTASYKITVTPTAIKLERIDVAYSTSSVADSSYRGAYLHAGTKGCFAKFYSINISP